MSLGQIIDFTITFGGGVIVGTFLGIAIMGFMAADDKERRDDK